MLSTGWWGRFERHCKSRIMGVASWERRHDLVNMLTIVFGEDGHVSAAAASDRVS